RQRGAQTPGPALLLRQSCGVEDRRSAKVGWRLMPTYMPASSRRSPANSGGLGSRFSGRWNRPCRDRRETANTWPQPGALESVRWRLGPPRGKIPCCKVDSFPGAAMPVGQTIRVRVAAPPAEARRLCTRLSRGGIPAAADDGASRAEVLVAVDPGTDLTQYRGRVGWLVVLGRPGAAYFAAGADDVVAPGEPELLFRRLRAALERLDLVSRVDRLNERVAALEGGLADAAHDVRSPLQAVIGNAELLSRDASLSPAQRECAAACARQGMRAMQLAERILEAAKQRSRDVLDVSSVDLGGLIETAAAQAQPVAKQRGVTLTVTPPSRPVEIHADGQLLGRILDNLIANALRFSPRGGAVEVEALRARPRFRRNAVEDP